MTSSLKRTFSDLNDENATKYPEPSAKRIKLADDQSMKTTFMNNKDHKECTEYLLSIEQADLIQSLQIPLDINREIAEFATGDIKQCGNKECKAGICVLNEAIIAFENGKETEWTYCNQKDVYFCELCEPSTIKFICCNTIQYVTEDRKCGACRDSDLPFCVDKYGDYSLLMGYKCNFCDALDDDRTCKDCGEWACYFHHDMRGCYDDKHNGCCKSNGFCILCDEAFCDGCDDENGYFCDKCWESFCGTCWKQQKDYMDCKVCDSNVCQSCHAEGKKLRVQMCRCNGKFYATKQFALYSDCTCSSFDKL